MYLGNIRQMAIIYSGATTFVQTQAAVAKAQSQAALAYNDFMPFEVILEGKGFKASLATSLAGLNAENVSVVIAMDVKKATIYKNSAAVGLALGAISKSKVSENIAWIEKFNLTGEGFAKAGFVGGEEIKTLGTLSDLNEKRYIFVKTHTGLPGVYFNDSHTCTTGTSDFAYVENNRTINKATRLMRTALLPKLASPVLVDIDGKLPQSVSKSFEGLCRSALEAMVANQEVSDFDVYVDPKQNILATSELKVKAEITPIGTARKIMVDLGFKNPFGIDKA
jgi:secreted trypsin-like serine protease